MHRSTLLKVTSAIGVVGVVVDLDLGLIEWSGSNAGCGLTLLLLHSSSTSRRVSAAADTERHGDGRSVKAHSKRSTTQGAAKVPPRRRAGERDVFGSSTFKTARTGRLVIESERQGRRTNLSRRPWC